MPSTFRSTGTSCASSTPTVPPAPSPRRTTSARAPSSSRACCRTSHRPTPRRPEPPVERPPWRWPRRCRLSRWCVYLAVGSPGAIDRDAEVQASAAQVEEMVARLAARLRENPDDVERLEAPRALVCGARPLRRVGRRLRQGGAARAARCEPARRLRRCARDGARPEPAGRAGEARAACARARARQPQGARARRHGRLRAQGFRGGRAVLEAHARRTCPRTPRMRAASART